MNDSSSVDFSIDVDVADAAQQIAKLKKAFEALHAQMERIAKAKTPTAQTEKDLQTVEKRLQGLMTRLGAMQSKLGKGLVSGAGSALQGATAAAEAAISQLFLAATAAAAGFAAGVGAALKQGIESNAQLEGLRDSIGMTIEAMYELTDAEGKPLGTMERIAAAAQEAARRLDEVRAATVVTGYDMNQLAAGLEKTLQQGAKKGLSLNLSQSIFEDIAIASSTLKIEGDKLIDEVKALMDLERLEDSELAQTLMLTPEMLQSWTKAGTLGTELKARLSDLAEAAKTSEQGLSTVSNRLKAGLSLALTSASEGATQALKDSMKGALERLFDGEGALLPQYQALYDQVEAIFTGLGEAIGSAIHGIIDIAEGLSAALESNEDVIAAIGLIFERVTDAIKGAVDWVAELMSGTGDAAAKAEFLEKAFKAVNVTIAAVADTIKVAAGAIGAVVSKVGEAAAWVIGRAGEVVGAEKVAEIARGVEEAARAVGESSKSLVQEGLRFREANKAINEDVNQSIADAKAGRERARKERELARKEREQARKERAADDRKAKAVAESETDRLKRLDEEKKRVDALTAAHKALAVARAAAAAQQEADAREEASARIDLQVARNQISRKAELAARQQLEVDALKSEAAALKAQRDEIRAEMLKEADQLKLADMSRQLVELDSKASTIASKQRILQIKVELDAEALKQSIEAEKSTLTTQLNELLGVPEDIAAQRKAALDTALAKSDASLSELVSKVFDAKEARALYDEQVRKFEELKQSLADTEAQYLEDYEAGAINILEYERKIREARLENAQALKAAAGDLKTAAQGTGNAALVKEAEAAGQAFKRVERSAESARNTMIDGFGEDVKTLFNDITRGAQSTSDALANFFISALTRIADKLADAWIGDLTGMFKGSSGAGGGWASMASSFFGAMGFATGGAVRGPGTSTSDSIPAWLSDGEYVNNAASTAVNRHWLDYANSGGSIDAAFQSAVARAAAMPKMPEYSPTLQSSVSVSPTVQLSVSEVQAALETLPQYEQAVTKVVLKNRRKLGIA